MIHNSNVTSYHLTQYYTEYGGTRFVDLGLQTHRIKCRVHDDFKLVEKVYACNSSLVLEIADIVG